MSKGDDNPKIKPRYKKIGPIGLYIIVMGVSLAVIYLLWASFGHIGPSFSSDILNKQQQSLRADYGLPKHPIITDPTILQTPPSLRDIGVKNNTTSTTNNTNSTTK
ncbi:MAG: hypothetical protein ABJB76_11890 [Candidatus Nitrosocosmicus sp.]